MNKAIKHILAKSNKNEKGTILLLTMVFMIVVTLMVVPLLTFSTTGIKTGVVYTDKADTLYAADSGIEDAKYQIKYDQLTGKFSTYDPYDYATTWNYSLPQVNNNPEINDKNVNIALQNDWIPQSITPLIKLQPTLL